jgi:phage tail sheath gpL-like
MASLTLVIKSPKGKENLDRILQSKPKSLVAVANLITGLACGAIRGELSAHTSNADPVAASATLTLDTVVATDVVVIGPVTFTGTDTPSTNLHFDTSLASDALIAADLAAKINAHPTAGRTVVASAAGDVVTVTSRVKGSIGNFINISSPDTTITASASHLQGGTGGPEGAPQEYKR